MTDIFDAQNRFHKQMLCDFADGTVKLPEILRPYEEWKLDRFDLFTLDEGTVRQMLATVSEELERFDETYPDGVKVQMAYVPTDDLTEAYAGYGKDRIKVSYLSHISDELSGLLAGGMFARA